MTGIAGRFLGRDRRHNDGLTVDVLSAALSGLPIGLAIFDADDRLAYCNDAFREVFEVSDDPIPTGTKYAAVLRGIAVKGQLLDVRRDEEAWLRERLSEHGKDDNDFRLTLRNGRSYDVMERRIATVGSVLIQLDVTDQIRREEASSTSENKARAMLDSVFDGVMTIGADGVVDTVNARCAEIFGRPVEGIIGNAVSTLIPEVPLQELVGEHVLGKIRHVHGRRGGDSTLDLEIAVSALPDTWSLPDRRRETRKTYVATLRDVTEQRALARQVQQAQRMDAIGTLAGGIAHDFNNILSIIMGYGALIQQDLPDGTEARENADMVVQASRRARELVEQILTFSRRTDDQTKQPFDPKPVVKEVLKLIRSTVPSSVEIDQDITDRNLLVVGDVSQLHQVLMNLCTNAAHAIGEAPGRIDVRLDAKRFGVQEAAAWGLGPGDYVQLSVSDSGPGIPADILERVFEPFFTTKERGQGTGLGLAVVHGIVTDHGGVVRAESSPGKGATIHMVLPLEPASTNETSQSKPVAPPTGAGRILFVDDEDLIVRMGQKILSRLGYTVVGATDSEEALEAFKAEPETFDLLVTDQTMPGLTGDMLISEVRSMRPEIPVILCTGYSQTMTPDRAREMGVDAFVMKPLEGDEVGRIVADVLKGRGA